MGASSALRPDSKGRHLTARNLVFCLALFWTVSIGRAQNTISDFVGCLNNKLVIAANLISNDKDDVSIADTVQCLPQGCMLTLNMSPLSAQKGFPLTVQGVTIQMPHVMLNCPGPAKGIRLRPAYVLFPG